MIAQHFTFAVIVSFRYVMILSIEPLKIYVFNDGLVRLATKVDDLCSIVMSLTVICVAAVCGADSRQCEVTTNAPDQLQFE